MRKEWRADFRQNIACHSATGVLDDQLLAPVLDFRRGYDDCASPRACIDRVRYEVDECFYELAAVPADHAATTRDDEIDAGTCGSVAQSADHLLEQVFDENHSF